MEILIKALEWWKSDTGDWCADTLVGRYQVQKVTANRNFRLFIPGIKKEVAQPITVYWPEDDAKAAAQTDYEQRIRSALVPPAQEPVADLIEAKATDRNGNERRVYIDRSRGVVLEIAEGMVLGLVEFAKEMCRIGFDGGSIDGCDILDTAVERGICTITQYRKDMQGIANAEYFEEGDAVYVFAPALTAVQEGR